MTEDITISTPYSTIQGFDTEFCFDKYLLEIGAVKINHPVNESITEKIQINRFQLDSLFIETLYLNDGEPGLLVVCDGFDKENGHIYCEALVPETKDAADALLQSIDV
jgi:hypothetical protein